MFFCITISTKEKIILKNFLVFLSKINLSNFRFFKQKQKKNVKKFLTILKSPHVNKTAQEQFEFRIFTRQIVLFAASPFLCLIVLKQIIRKGFPGVKIKLIYIFDKKKQNRILLYSLNPDNVKFNIKIKKNIKNYFFMFDSYGESFLQKQLFNKK